MKPKISYHKRWDAEGTVYTQCISISKLILDTLKTEVLNEIKQGYKNKEQYVFTSGCEFYLKPITQTSLVYLNHTQTRFINLFLKLDLKDRNTCLKVK